MKNNLKYLRIKNKIKQQALADYLQMSIRQYQRLEKETPKSIIHFWSLAKFYNTNIGILLDSYNS